MYELLAEWRDGLEGAEYKHIRQLLDTNPTLLWQPIPFNELEYPNTMTHLKDNSQNLFKGISISHVYGIQFLIFNIFENSLSSRSDEATLLSFLIESATAVDLNTCFWGSTKNTTLHLASNLGQPVTTIQQLLDRGASEDIPNSDGYLAKDVALEESIKDMLSSRNDKISATDTAAMTTTTTTTNRFERLRQLAQDGGSMVSSNLLSTTNPMTKRQNSTRKYFQPGHLEERRRKVLQEDADIVKTEQDDKNAIEKLKKNNMRQREVESLAKQSRVKNNPFLKKFEQQHQEQQERRALISPLNQNNRLNPRLETLADRRISKGISTLKGGSFVSTSVFRRHQGDALSGNAIDDSDDLNIDHTNNEYIANNECHDNAAEENVTKANTNTPSTANDGEQNAHFTELQNQHIQIGEKAASLDAESIKPIEALPYDKQSDNNKLESQSNSNTNNQTASTATQQSEIDLTPTSHPENAKPPAHTELPISKIETDNRISPTRKSHLSMVSDAGSEQWFDSNEEYAENETRKSVTPTEHLPPLPVITFDHQSANHTKDNIKDDLKIKFNNSEQQYPTQSVQNSLKYNQHEHPPGTFVDVATVGDDGLPRLSHETEVSNETFEFHSPPLTDNESIDTWPPPSPKSDIGYHRNSIGHISTASLQETATPKVVHDTSENRAKVDDQEDELDVEETKEQAFRPVILATNSNFVVRRLSLNLKNDDNADDSGTFSPTTPLPPQLQITVKDAVQQQIANVNSMRDEKQAEYSSYSNEPILAPTVTENMPHPILPLIPETATSGYGKMYIRMTNAHDILLPLPAETTYVRSVISDGRQEYVSRYEVLSNKVQFQYECTMDTYPNMIVSIALQVRPDPHVRPITGFLNKILFTSIHRQKKTLQGYVHPEEYFIGQARFAIEDMTTACNQKTYNASFDCFNSWFVQSTKERKRGTTTPDGQIIKVVGQLAVDMLYLPVSDPSMNVPVSLQECDIALRIRQWHGTCWRSGYLSTRQKNGVTWNRQYFRLIGSQLLGFDSVNESKDYVDHYDITDAVQLIVAAEQVLVNMDNSNRQQQQVIFSQNTICEDNRKGFFRITFSNGCHIDCVSDQASESELWVKTLRAMIGRVPLTVSASIFLE